MERTYQRDGSHARGQVKIRCSHEAWTARTLWGCSDSTDPQAVWALLKERDRKWTLARFDGERWSNIPLDQEAQCIAETKPGVAYLGTSRGLMKVVWPVKEVELLQGPNETVLKVVGGSSNSVICASWFRLYEKTPAP